MWKKSEEEYLIEEWGSKPEKAICEALGKSVYAVRSKVYRLGLGRSWEASGEFCSFHRIYVTVWHRRPGKNTYKYFKRLGFPFRKKTNGSRTIYKVRLKDFWKWAERNREMISFRLLEEYALGYEPAWVKVQRKAEWKTYVEERWSA